MRLWRRIPWCGLRESAYRGEAGNARREVFSRTTELMTGLDFVVQRALAYRMPVAINISFGNKASSMSFKENAYGQMSIENGKILTMVLTRYHYILSNPKDSIILSIKLLS